MAVKSIDIIKSYLTEGKYPTASELVNVLDTLVSIGQNSGGDTSGLAAVAISGDYNDLTNKPTVPAISTNITSDATSDTKTTSPKAVKDFVEGKGYLTQHQDISGKANQTDLEALEDRVETLEQSGSGGGDTTQYSYLKLIPDLDAYTEAPVGEIVKYIGQNNDKYTRGWDYEKVSDTPQSRAATSIVYTDDVPEALKQSIDSLTFPLSYDNEEVPVYYFSAGSTSSPERFASVGTKTPAIGDPIFACDGSAVYHVTNTSTSGSKYYINIDHPTRTSSYELNINKTFFKWHDSNGNTVLLRHSINGSGDIGSGYQLINEDVFIEKDNMMYFGSNNGKTKAAYDDLQIPLWQPILMPTASN